MAHAGGCPSKLNKKMIKDLCHYIERGVAIKYATDAVGISTETYHAWINKGRSDLANNIPSLHAEFSDAVAKIKAKFISSAIEKIKKAGQSKKNWQANTWLLERLYQGGYGRDSAEVEQLAKDIEQIKNILFNDIDPNNTTLKDD